MRVDKHNGICDNCGSFSLVFGFEGYECQKCGYEGDCGER